MSSQSPDQALIEQGSKKISNEDTGFHNGLIDIGGRRLFIEWGGTGTPTVVLEAGLGTTRETWDPIWPALSQMTRACRYDRAGLGKSDPGPTPRTAQDAVSDLHRLLSEAGVPGPYILVGHSFAGLNVRLYAHCYPQEVVGLVLVDASQPDQWARGELLLPPPEPDEPDDLRGVRESGLSLTPVEDFERQTSCAQVRAATLRPDLPLIVLMHATQPEELADAESWWATFYPPETARQLALGWSSINLKLQTETAQLSSQGKLIVVEQSGHFIHSDQPALVIQVIREVIEVTRSRLGSF